METVYCKIRNIQVLRHCGRCEMEEKMKTEPKKKNKKSDSPIDNAFQTYNDFSDKSFEVVSNIIFSDEEDEDEDNEEDENDRD